LSGGVGEQGTAGKKRDRKQEPPSSRARAPWRSSTTNRGRSKMPSRIASHGTKEPEHRAADGRHPRPKRSTGTIQERSGRSPRRPKREQSERPSPGPLPAENPNRSGRSPRRPKCERSERPYSRRTPHHHGMSGDGPGAHARRWQRPRGATRAPTKPSFPSPRAGEKGRHRPAPRCEQISRRGRALQHTEPWPGRHRSGRFTLGESLEPSKIEAAGLRAGRSASEASGHPPDLCRPKSQTEAAGLRAGRSASRASDHPPDLCRPKREQSERPYSRRTPHHHGMSGGGPGAHARMSCPIIR